MRQKGINTAYYGSEKSIMDAFSKLLGENHSFNIRPGDITKKAGLAKSSFYIHYRSVPDLIEVNEQKVLNSVTEAIGVNGFDILSPETKWRNILMNLYKYHEILGIMMKARNYELSEKILDKIEKNVIICPQNQKIMNDNLMNITRKCLMSELDLWSNEDFDVDEISSHAHRLAYISTCAPRFFWQIFG